MTAIQAGDFKSAMRCMIMTLTSCTSVVSHSSSTCMQLSPWCIQPQETSFFGQFYHGMNSHERSIYYKCWPAFFCHWHSFKMQCWLNFEFLLYSTTESISNFKFADIVNLSRISVQISSVMTSFSVCCHH